MSAKHKVITKVVNTPGQAQTLAKVLNDEAVDGWRVQQVSTGVYKRRGEYFTDTHCVVLEKAESRYEYVCVFHRRPLALGSSEGRPKLNDKIREQEDEGFSLVQLLQTAVINPDQDRQESASSGYLLIFEKPS